MKNLEEWNMKKLRMDNQSIIKIVSLIQYQILQPKRVGKPGKKDNNNLGWIMIPLELIMWPKTNINPKVEIIIIKGEVVVVVEGVVEDMDIDNNIIIWDMVDITITVDIIIIEEVINKVVDMEEVDMVVEIEVDIEVDIEGLIIIIIIITILTIDKEMELGIIIMKKVDKVDKVLEQHIIENNNFEKGIK